MSAHDQFINSKLASEDLLKNGLADRLRAEIVGGSLAPGERIVERIWAQKYGVAQASIREAINILEKNGFVIKQPGQTAQVIHLTDTDIAQIYQVRAALEGMAAYLAASSTCDVSELRAIVGNMRKATAENNPDEMVDCDLKFHLELCRLAGNPHLIDHAVRILLPFFAFFRLRVVASGRGIATWDRDVDAHHRIVDLIEEGEAALAEHYVRAAMGRFAGTAQKNWMPRESAP